MDINYNHPIADVKTENIVLSGNRGDLLITGILNGAVVVKAPATLRIQGIMNGDLVVDEGAFVEIRGILNAKSILCAGVLDIYGIVTCASGVPRSAVFHDGCVVNGVQH